MPGFSDSFWSSDYAAGLGVLFGKLHQGTIENRQVLSIAKLRADAEEAYGTKLGDIAPAADKLTGGFGRDDGATVRKAYEGMRQEMADASKNHKKIAQNIRQLVVTPFSRWCDAHDARIQDSQDELQSRIKEHDRQAELVKKLRSYYFNKCRLVEDLEEEEKLAFQDPETTSPKAKGSAIPAIKVNKEPDPKTQLDDDEPYDIGEHIYSPEQMKKMLSAMMSKVKMGETKVPILGTYQNTSTGADIVEYLQREMGASSVAYAEQIGQDLVTNGILRLVGNVGSTFANSSKMNYQWRPKAFQLSGLPEKRPTSVARTFTLPVSEDSSPVVGTVTEYLQGWNVISSGPAGETANERLRREARETDEKYKKGVRKLDQMRCELEESIFLHLRFLERCELDRLKAIKTVILDFSGTISNVIPSLQSGVDKMMLFQETVQPLNDLRYLLENYRTGSFVPRVVTYENYYNKVDEQTFGVDLEARARADKKRVPLLVTTVLTYLDQHYPDLESDEVRRNVWLADVSLATVHKLRAELNTGKPPNAEVLAKFDIPTVAMLLKLYLLELPDSLVSSHVYEIIRQLYTQPVTAEAVSESRVSALQTTLSQLRLSNVATLDACMNHFTRLIDLTSADEEYVHTLATTLAPCILRPRQETSLTMEEKHAYRLLRDLFEHKEAIFDELKRLAAMQHLSSGSVKKDTAIRPRAISTDESNRRANVEERNRLILEKSVAGSRSRAASPAATPRQLHRRDRSIGAADTRFPISPTASSLYAGRPTVGSVLAAGGTGKRQSLDVPGAENFDDAGSVTSPPRVVTNVTSSPASVTPSDDTAAAAATASAVNSTSNAPRTQSPSTTTPSAITAVSSATSVPGPAAVEELKSDHVPIKRNSLGRSNHVTSRIGSGRRITAGSRDSPISAGAATVVAAAAAAAAAGVGNNSSNNNNTNNSPRHSVRDSVSSTAGSSGTSSSTVSSTTIVGSGIGSSKRDSNSRRDSRRDSQLTTTNKEAVSANLTVLTPGSVAATAASFEQQQQPQQHTPVTLVDKPMDD